MISGSGYAAYFFPPVSPYSFLCADLCDRAHGSVGSLGVVSAQIDPCIVRHVRLLLKSGHGNFVAVYSISAEGTPIEEQYTRGRG